MPCSGNEVADFDDASRRQYFAGLFDAAAAVPKTPTRVTRSVAVRRGSRRGGGSETHILPAVPAERSLTEKEEVSTEILTPLSTHFYVAPPIPHTLAAAATLMS